MSVLGVQLLSVPDKNVGSFKLIKLIQLTGPHGSPVGQDRDVCKVHECGGHSCIMESIVLSASLIHILSWTATPPLN